MQRASWEQDLAFKKRGHLLAKTICEHLETIIEAQPPFDHALPRLGLVPLFPSVFHMSMMPDTYEPWSLRARLVKKLLSARRLMALPTPHATPALSKPRPSGARGGRVASHGGRRQRRQATRSWYNEQVNALTRASDSARPSRSLPSW